MKPMISQHDLSQYPEPIQAILKAQFKLSQCMVNTQMHEWATLELSIGQLKALMMLGGEPDMTISQLADSLGIGKPSTSILVDRLVQLRLAQRTEDENDRRRTLVTLTPAGDELTARLRQGNRERLVQWYSTLAPEDLAALRQGMEALIAVATASNATETTETTDSATQPSLA